MLNDVNSDGDWLMMPYIPSLCPCPLNALKPGSRAAAAVSGPTTGGRPRPQSAHFRLSQSGVARK